MIDFNLLSITGWLGSVLLIICGAPQAFKSLREGHSKGVSLSFLLLWLMGEVLMLIYSLLELKIWLLMFNYLGNILFILIIIYYKLKPRKL